MDVSLFRIGLILPPAFLCDVDVSELHSNLRVLKSTEYLGVVISELRKFCWVGSPNASRSRDKQKKYDLPRRDKPPSKGASCVLLPTTSSTSARLCEVFNLQKSNLDWKPCGVVWRNFIPFKELVLQFLQTKPSDTKSSSTQSWIALDRMMAT